MELPTTTPVMLYQTPLSLLGKHCQNCTFNEILSSLKTWMLVSGMTESVLVFLLLPTTNC